LTARVVLHELLLPLLLLALLFLLPPVFALLALVFELRGCLRCAQARCDGERRPNEETNGGAKKARHETSNEERTTDRIETCDLQANVLSPSLPRRYYGRTTSMCVGSAFA
jgi:hypothetical protein